MRRTPVVPLRKRVLVVEDDGWIRRFMRDILCDEGYDVTEAADGRTAIRLVAEQSPDLVLLDVAMPDFTGVDVLRHLRSKRRTKDLPVVIVSATRACCRPTMQPPSPVSWSSHCVSTSYSTWSSKPLRQPRRM
jgi:CheY-like chemotaxis protein